MRGTRRELGSTGGDLVTQVADLSAFTSEVRGHVLRAVTRRDDGEKRDTSSSTAMAELHSRVGQLQGEVSLLRAELAMKREEIQGLEEDGHSVRLGLRSLVKELDGVKSQSSVAVTVGRDRHVSLLQHIANLQRQRYEERMFAVQSDERAARCLLQSECLQSWSDQRARFSSQLVSSYHRELRSSAETCSGLTAQLGALRRIRNSSPALQQSTPPVHDGTSDLFSSLSSTRMRAGSGLAATPAAHLFVETERTARHQLQDAFSTTAQLLYNHHNQPPVARWTPHRLPQQQDTTLAIEAILCIEDSVAEVGHLYDVAKEEAEREVLDRCSVLWNAIRDSCILTVAESEQRQVIVGEWMDAFVDIVALRKLPTAL